MSTLTPLRMDDRTLSARIRTGSMEALGEAYARHGPAVFRVARHILGEVAAAEDVLQDVFVGLASALRSFDDRQAMGPWIVRVAARMALARLRSGRRRLQREGHFAARLPPSQPPDHGGAFAGDAALDRALAALPERLRTVLLLREVDGLTHDEIGRLLDITPASSAVRLHRALRKLRQELSRPT